MPKRGEITDIVDTLLKFSVFGGMISAGFIAPNSVQAFEKPAYKLLKKLDKRKRERERELIRVLSYMKENDLIEGDYQHGLQITKKGRKRAERVKLGEISVQKPKKWDGKWRIVMFDIPEERKTGRDILTRKLKDMHFYQLQKSVWLNPFRCREEIEYVTTILNVDKFVTYIETSFVDKEEILKKHFKLQAKT